MKAGFLNPWAAMFTLSDEQAMWRVQMEDGAEWFD
jgi:hypothetical protein